MQVLSILKVAVLAAVLVFAGGFCFGIIRIFYVMPRLGPVGAVLAELPFMLALSVLIWRRLLVSGSIQGPAASAVTGLCAFLLLSAFEFALAALAFGSGASDYLASLGSPAGLIGLAGQAVFGVLPVILRRRNGP